MKTRFEIKSQLGLARSGKLTLGEHSIKTPNLLVPINTTIIKQIEIQKNLGGNKDDIDSDMFVGYDIQDPLHLFSSANKNQYDSFFTESREIWGIPTIFQNENQLQSDLSKKLLILAENFPNTKVKRFQSYELAAQSTRLRMYEEILFKKFPDKYFIVEFTFKEDPKSLDCIIDWVLQNQDHLIGIRIRDIFANLMQANKILKWVFTLKNKLPSNLLWIAGGKILPQNYGLAVYLGFDLIDLRSVFQMGIKGLYITPNTTKWLRELRFPLCSCNACQQLTSHLNKQKKESSHIISLISKHNFYTAVGELFRLKQGIADKSLRTYIEAKIHSSPLAAAFLRLIDSNYSTEINSRYPIISSHLVKCIGSESYTRPEIINFINRVKKEVTPARIYKMVVILPCSAKKPYSLSRSHQKFQKFIRKAAGKQYDNIHQVIITSPTGVIPRELEKVFPAGHYDIPVTGEWDAFEIRSTAVCLAEWLKKYIPEKKSPLTIIAHLSGGYQKACEIAELFLSHEPELKNHFNFVYSMPLGKEFGASNIEGLNSLEAAISENLSQITTDEESTKSLSNYTKITKDEIIIRATMDYQFGKGAGDIITKGGAILIKSKWPQYNEIYVYDGAGKLLFGRLYTNTGLIKLAPRGAELLLSFGKNQIKIKEDNLQGTTIFRPIMDTIDPSAHPGDEMIVVNKNGVYLGVGELIQAPPDAKISQQGAICKLRKKVKHFATEAPKTQKSD